MNTIVEHGGLNHEKGLERLKAHLSAIGEQSNDFYIYEARLIEALNSVRLYSSNEAQTELRIVVDRLNQLARNSIGVSYNDLCLAETFLQKARKIQDEGLRENSVEKLQEAIKNLQKFIQCEVPAPFRRELTDYEKELAPIKSHIEFIEKYQQLAPLRHQDNWEEVIAQYRNIQHLCYPTAPPDGHGFLAWAQLQEESQKQCDAMQQLLDSGNCLAVLQQCRKFNTPRDQKKQFDVVERIVTKVKELEMQALEQEVEQALKDTDWFRAVRILRSLYKLDQTRKDVKRWIREQLQNHLRDYLEQSLEWFFIERDPRPGVVSLDIAWSHALPLPYSHKFVNKTFQIAQFPVTVWQFRQFIENKGYQAENNHCWTALGREWRDDEAIHLPYGWDTEARQVDNQPVTGVSWYEAQAFCRWLTARQCAWGWLTHEEELRLPTKEEWQLAAKRFPGANIDKTWDKDGLFMRRNYSELGRNCPTPVGLFPENVSPCGAYDMAGNVWEWCSSGQHNGVEAEVPENDFDAFDDDIDLCGGSYLSEDNQAHWDGETQSVPHKQKPDFGFRLCRSPVRKAEVE